MSASPALRMLIENEAAKLDLCFSRIENCRVIIEAPHDRRRRGNAYHVTIEIGMPHTQIVVSNTPSMHGRNDKAGAEHLTRHLESQPDHKDAYVAVRDAFATAQRQLKDYSSKLRGEVKHHATQSFIEP